MARTLKVLVPVAGSSEYKAVTSSSGNVNGTALVAGKTYVFSTSIDAYIAQGATPTAAAADGSMMVPAGSSIYIHGNQGTYLAVLRVGSSDGVCTIQEMTTVTP